MNKKEYFMSKVIVTETCWLWQQHLDRDGYGTFRWEGKRYRAHRTSYELFKGPIQKELICHHCDNPQCVNPEHLFEGTYLDNMLDKQIKGRSAWGEKSNTNKLKQSDIKLIKERYKTLNSYRKVAKEFNVYYTTIARIVKNQAWRVYE